MCGQGQREKQRISRLQDEHGTEQGAESHDLEIMT